MLGGRKFAFINVPPLGCLPTIRNSNGSCLKETSLLSTFHNKALSKLLRELEEQLKGFKHSHFDLNSFLEQRINHPSQFGMSYDLYSIKKHSHFFDAGICGLQPQLLWSYFLCPYSSLD
jgi:phospholipase/lecithinase/hemolysin